MRRVHTEYYGKNSKKNNKKKELLETESMMRIKKKKSRNFGRYSWKNSRKKWNKKTKRRKIREK